MKIPNPLKNFLNRYSNKPLSSQERGRGEVVANITPQDDDVPSKPDMKHIELVPYINRFNNYPSVGLTPESLTEIFKMADQGDISRQAELFEEMREKDLHLFGVSQSRNNAVSKLAYQIPSASDNPKDEQIAEFCRLVFKNMKRRKDVIKGILDAVPQGVSAQQKIWKNEDGKIILAGTEFTHMKNFRFGKATDITSDFTQLRRLTMENMVDGVELEKQKWLISIIQARSGHPARTSLLRTFAWSYMFKNFDVKAWVQLAEMYGLPLRKGTYPIGASDEDKGALYQALYQIGQDAIAMVPEGTNIEFIEAVQKAASSAIHKDLAEFCNQEMSIGYLGHAGAAEGTPGKLGQDQTAQEVRFDLIESDASDLDAIVTEQMIVPLVVFNFGPQESYPQYKTLIEPQKDRAGIAKVLSAARNDLGMAIPRKHAYTELGIPEPQEDEEVLLPPTFAPPPVPGQFRSDAGNIIVGDGKKKV